MPKYYRIQDVSKEVSRYIEQKSLKVSPDGWRDVYAQEHAAAFTVAKLKDLNLLGSVQKEIAHSIEHGDTFKDFKKRVQPKLQSWLDSVRRPPPKEVEGLRAPRALEGPELDKWKAKRDRYRLRRIFETNTRQAYSQHYYQQGMNNEFVSHVIYRIGPSINHRADHVALDGLVLPKTHPIWDTHWPPNGWNCKCYVRFIGKKKLENYRKNGVPDLQSADPKTGRFTRNKAIFETAPPIRYRWFSRDHGLDVAVPADIDPGFEWNPGQFNRGTWLKDQALKKTRALELHEKEQQKLERLIVANAAQQQAYQAFVSDRYGKRSNGQSIDVGIVQDVLKVDFAKRQGSLPDSDMIMMQDKVLNAKDQRHGKFFFGDSSVSKAEFLNVPKMLQKPDMLVWDKKRQQYVIVMHTKKRQLLFLPIGINQIKAMKNDFWTLRSVYRVESYSEVFEERWNRQYRYEMISPKK